MDFLEKIKEIKSDSYDTWFERWYEKKTIESRIKIAASQGYDGINLLVSAEQDEYTRRRLDDERVIDKLQDKLPGFEIKFLESSGDKMFLNSKVGTWYKKQISISWREKTND